MISGERIVRTSCRGCHGVCQVLVHLDANGRVKKVSGDPESPTSRGYLCSKGLAAPEFIYHPDRLTRPMRRSCANLLFGHEYFDADSGAELLKSGICRPEKI